MTLERLLPPPTTPRNNFYELPLFELRPQKSPIFDFFYFEFLENIGEISSEDAARNVFLP